MFAKSNNKFPYYVGKIPFIYKINESVDNHEGIPNSWDFTLDFDKDSGLLKQVYNAETEAYLDRAYKLGSIITGHMDDYEYGKLYNNDFIDYVIENEKLLSGRSILEIGCGTGFLLNNLKNLGANVVGIEPGEDNHQAKSKYDIEIVSDYFPSSKITDKFDIIIFYNVLEHISNLEFFLINVKAQLKANGRVYFAVPDCSRAILSGDISMLIHEHIYYFTNGTLSNTIQNILKVVPKIEKSKFGSELYGLISFNIEVEKYDNNCDEIANQNYEFLRKSQLFQNSLKNFFSNKIKANESIGIYVPARIVNSLSLFADSIELKNVFFYDDDPNLYNKYFPGFNIRIEDKRALLETQLDYLLVFSYSFSEQIYKNIANLISQRTNVLFIDDFLEGGKYEDSSNGI